MPIPVSDRSANRPELIQHAVEVIGRSAQRLAVFTEVYRGKRKVKTVSELMERLGLPRNRVLDAGLKLASNDIVHQVKVDGETGYEKIDFYQQHRAKILRFVRNPKAMEKMPTKRRSGSPAATNTMRLKLDFRVPARRVRARRFTIDDADSFRKVRRHKQAELFAMSEARFKRGMARILGEKGAFKDWGGELRDLKSSRLRIRGKRKDVAFAFKGPATKGRLTPAKMGKNGDQIQRLFRCPADVFVVQFGGEIDDAVVEQMERFAQLKSFLEDREIWYGVIDGGDTARIIAAYPEAFT